MGSRMGRIRVYEYQLEVYNKCAACTKNLLLPSQMVQDQKEEGQHLVLMRSPVLP